MNEHFVAANIYSIQRFELMKSHWISDIYWADFSCFSVGKISLSPWESEISERKLFNSMHQTKFITQLNEQVKGRI